MVMFLTGINITAIRQALGMSQEEFGQRAGVSRVAVCRWESNQRRPEYEMMERLNKLAEEGGLKDRQPAHA